MTLRVNVNIGGSNQPALLIRRGRKNSRVYFEGNDNGILIPTTCIEDIPPINVPTTPLHRLYYDVKSAHGLNSFDTIKQRCGETPDEAHEYLMQRFEESVSLCRGYRNLEPFYPPGSRSGKHRNRDNYAHLLVSMLEHSKYAVTGFDCSYVDREISCLRTTNANLLGDQGSDPRLCSMDILLCRDETAIPVITEVKAAGDKGPAYALVQLLKYAAEMGSKHQGKRLKQFFPRFNNPGVRPCHLEIQAIFEKTRPGKSGELSWTEGVSRRMMNDQFFHQRIQRVMFRHAEIQRSKSRVEFCDLFEAVPP